MRFETYIYDIKKRKEVVTSNSMKRRWVSKTNYAYNASKQQQI